LTKNKTANTQTPLAQAGFVVYKNIQQIFFFCLIRILFLIRRSGDTQMVTTETLKIKTKGSCDIIDITDKVQAAVAESSITSGAVVVFNVGSTAGITTVEYEPGLVNYDIKAAFEKVAPQNGHYEHEKTWHDDNGHSHVRASMLGPSLTVPFVNGKLTLGTWQQIVLVDFDTRPRTRTVICQIIG